jgi:uroporphyrinogen-III synthase
MRVLEIPSDRLKHLHVAAIGPATAVAVGHIGLKVAAMPEEYVAEAVVAMLQDKVSGKHVLLARAAVARDIIPEQLRKCGADIHVVETYRTVVPADSIGQVRELFGEGKPLPDAVTFTSSSTVNNFFTLLAAAKIDLPKGLRAVSIGPVTTRTLRQHNWEPACEAIKYDIPGVVGACVSLFALNK